MKEIMKHIFFATGIIAALLQPMIVWSMEQPMPALVPDESTAPALPVFSRTVPPLVMCCLKPICAAYNNETADITQQKYKSLFWELNEKIGCPFYWLPLEESNRYTDIPWKTDNVSLPRLWLSCALAAAYHNIITLEQQWLCCFAGQTMNKLALRDAFLHYVDTFLTKNPSPTHLKSLHDQAIEHHMPIEIFKKLQECGFNQIKFHYLDNALISHNVEYVQYLCQQGISLKEGWYSEGILHAIVQYVRHTRSLNGPADFLQRNIASSIEIMKCCLHYKDSLYEETAIPLVDILDKPNKEGLTAADAAWVEGFYDIAHYLDEQEDVAKLQKPKRYTYSEVYFHDQIPARFDPIQERTRRRQEALAKRQVASSENP